MGLFENSNYSPMFIGSYGLFPTFSVITDIILGMPF